MSGRAVGSSSGSEGATAGEVRKGSPSNGPLWGRGTGGPNRRRRVGSAGAVWASLGDLFVWVREVGRAGIRGSVGGGGVPAAYRYGGGWSV